MARPAVPSQSTRLSTKGQLILPKEIRERLGWTPGLELMAEVHGDSVVLRRAEGLPATTLEDLVGCAGYKGPTRTLEDMGAAIGQGARERR